MILVLVGSPVVLAAQATTAFLEKYCVQCLGAGNQKGKVTLHDLGTNFSDSDTADRWIEILGQLTTGDMPPEEAEHIPGTSERSEMIEWIEEGMKQSGRDHAYRKKLLAPEYGNWVDHEKLFSGEIRTPPFSPSRIWRLSPEIFKRKGFGRARSPFTYITPQKGIRDYSAISQVDQSTVQMILINTGQFLEQREQNGEFGDFTKVEGISRTRFSSGECPRSSDESSGGFLRKPRKISISRS